MTIHLLLVEDEIFVRNGIQKMLESNRSDLTVHVAADIYEAKACLKTEVIHLLLLDIQLPEIDGLTFLASIRDSYSELPVIILSAHADFYYAQQAIDLNVIKYLTKPVSKDALLEIIEHCLTAIPLNPDIDHISIKEAIDYLHKYYKEPLTLQCVAEFVHLNPSYFSTLFKQSMGVNFSQYLTTHRIQQSKNLLQDNHYSIEDVAIQSGYQSAKYFIKIFKEYEKITPNQYRKQRFSK